MPASEHVIEVSEADFEYEVIQYSRHKPVIVDFWAEWSKSSLTLSPVLEELVKEANGRFRLAKVDADENPNLLLRFNVRNIPAVKGFRMGQIAAEFLGVVPRTDIENFLKELTPGTTDILLVKGLNLLQFHRWADAEASFRKVLGERKDYPPALLGLSKSLLAQNKVAEVQKILKSFPASKEYASAEILRPLVDALTQTSPLVEMFDREAIYIRALNLIKNTNFPAALDGLLELLRLDKNYRKGQARKVTLGLLEILGDENEMTRQYRAELASILF